MEIRLELPEDFLSDEEKTRLNSLFNTSTDDEFKQYLSKIIIASLSEYKEMLLGGGLPSRADEILQQRLFFLIENYFGDEIPSEDDVSEIFQLTQTRSRSLIRSTLTRYHYQLKAKKDKTFKNIILNDINPKKDEKNENTKCKLIISSDIVVEELNRIIARLTKRYSELERITKVPYSARAYSISRKSYEKLCDEFGVTIPSWPDELK